MNRLIVLVTLLGTAHVLVVRAGAGWGVTLLLWLVSIGALTFWAALIGSAVWGLQAAVAGRRPDFVAFQRYAGAGAGLVFGLLVLRALVS